MPTDLAVGVDLGGTKILTGLVDRSGRARALRESPTPTTGGDAVLKAIEDAIAEVLADEEAVAAGESCAAIGVSVPAFLDPRTGAVQRAGNLPLVDVNLVGRLAARFGLPVSVENDGTLAAFAEWRCGAGLGHQTVVALTLGTGVGGGLVLDGRLYRGWFEAGHLVVSAGGVPCQGSCTGRGHLEALCSGTAARRLAHEVFGADVDPPEVLDRARSGDERAAQIVEELGAALGNGVASLVSLFNPDVIVVGGGFGAAGADLLLPAAEKTARREAISWGPDRPRLVPAALGPSASVIGAALLAFEELAA